MTEPGATLCAVLGSVGSWLGHWLPLVGSAVVLALSGVGWGLRRWRQACLRSWHDQAQIVTVESPPSVSAHGAQSLWANVTELVLRPWWKRVLFGTPALAWEYVFTRDGVTIELWVPGPVEVSHVQRAIEAAWPGAHTRVQESTAPLPDSRGTRRVAACGGTLRLARPEALPIQTEITQWDPLRAVLAAPGALPKDDRACVQVLVRPATGGRLARAQATATPATRPGPTGASPVTTWGLGVVRALLDLLTPGAGATAPSGAGTHRARTGDPQIGREATTQSRAMVDKRHSGQCETLVRYAVTTTVPEPASPYQWRAAQAQLRTRAHALASSLAGFRGHNYYRSHRLRQPRMVLARRGLGRGDLLSLGELATLAHLPDPTVAAGLAQAGAKALAPPVGIASPGAHVKPLGASDTSHAAAVGLRVADARHHLHVLGATGVGKSTVLAQMLLDDIDRHRGVVVIDPKGDLVTDLLGRLPAEAADRLVLFDPDQPGPVPCLNPLHGRDRDLAVDQLVSVFGRIYAGSWGPRTEDVFRSACLTLRAHGGVSTLADLPRLLDEPAFRARVTAGLSDPVLRGFWTWYESLSDSARSAAIAPLMNKLRAFLLRPFVRDALAGGRSTVDMGQVLDGGICLVRIPKGQLGDETTQLFGSLIVAGTWQAATARAHTPHHQRHDASVVLDECANFLHLPYSLEDMLAEARGYRCSLTLAHQHLGQLGRELREGIATNARNKVYFTAGPDDARDLARHTAPHLSEHDLSHLGAFHAAARLVVRGEETPPFTLSTQPLSPVIPGRAHDLRTHAAQALLAPTGTDRRQHRETDGDAAVSQHRRAGPVPASDPHDDAGEHAEGSTWDSPARPSTETGHTREPDEILLDPDPGEPAESSPPGRPRPRHRAAPGRDHKSLADDAKAPDPRR